MRAIVSPLSTPPGAGAGWRRCGPPSVCSLAAELVAIQARYAGASARVVGLIWTLVRTDFKTRYHGTVGGFVWALLKPFTMFLVLITVFSFVFSSDRNYNLNLVLGLFLWDFFAETTKVGIQALASKSYLL